MKTEYKGSLPIYVDPLNFEKEEMTLDEYIEEVKKRPSIIFNPFQRLYAALTMFGYEERKGRTRYKFLDDLVELPGKPAGMDALYGIDDVVERVVSFLENASQDITEQGRFILLYGPPGTAKSTLVKLMGNTLDGYLTTDVGALYTVKFDLSGLEEFGGIEEVISPSRESPLSFLSAKERNKLLGEIEDKLEGWQKPNPDLRNDPATNYIIGKFREAGKLGELRERIKVVRMWPLQDVVLARFSSREEKDYNPSDIFGGGKCMKMFSKIGEMEHPLVINYGIGGRFDGPSPAYHIVHFSEIYKTVEGFKNRFLDLVQERKLNPTGNYEIPVRSVVIGTTNMGEYEEAATNPKLGAYLTSRAVEVDMTYILVMDDMAETLRKKVFNQNNRVFEKVHIPPHFVESFLAPLSVMAALVPPDEGITLLQKAQIYNDEEPEGLEYNKEKKISKEELMRKYNEKTPLEREEGIKRGVPFRLFEDLPKDVKRELKKVVEKSELVDEDYNEGCLLHINIEKFFESIFKTYTSISNETRKTVLEKVLPECYNLWEKAMANDVLIAATGSEDMEKLATRYLAMVYELERGGSKYRDPFRETLENIDREFIEGVEEYVTSNKVDFRRVLANAVKHRLPEKKKQGSEHPMRELAKDLLEENERFRNAIRNYILEDVLPRRHLDMDSILTEENSEIVQNLKKMGYCDKCAVQAVAAAKERKKEKEE